ncbi:MAG: isochorismatase family protein [Candidatus Heimdallarchaeum endolithica]|uniref:Isochorismatase family protein n=1 Tax=Candidatus Heimdallarchaeum endolithica TaxID=2876572 RepID=A0A9Y1FN50_9ARCH|nr:MAG: isochorismatase family protein [Candidatus Heimdallarchaeum endolithica]
MKNVNLNDMDHLNSVIVVIDAQQSILSATKNWKDVLNKIEFLLSNAIAFNIPVFFTEQYPKGLGSTIGSLSSIVDDKVTVIQKMEFNCFDNENFVKHLNSYFSLKYFIIVGVETHICVLQTALGALEHNLIPIVISDATSSRNETDYKIAVNLFNQFEIPILTAEIFSYLVTKTTKSDRFKHLLKNVKKFNN